VPKSEGGWSISVAPEGRIVGGSGGDASESCESSGDGTKSVVYRVDRRLS